MLTLKNTGSLFFCQKLKKVAGRQFSEAKKTSCQTKKPAGSQKNGLPKLASRRVGAKKTSWQIENKASRKLRAASWCCSSTWSWWLVQRQPSSGLFGQFVSGPLGGGYPASARSRRRLLAREPRVQPHVGHTSPGHPALPREGFLCGSGSVRFWCTFSQAYSAGCFPWVVHTPAWALWWNALPCSLTGQSLVRLLRQVRLPH